MTKSFLTMVKNDDGLKFSGEIAWSDVQGLKLFPLDKALMRTTGFNSPPEDHLLVIEMLFRRINEQKEQL